MSYRHAVRRARHAALKADAVILLDRITALGIEGQPLHDGLLLQIAEMRMRLAPPTGIKAPIIRTGYTRRKA